MIGSRTARSTWSSTPSELRLLPWWGERLGAAICYEVVFPREVAELVRAGATALVTITNDGWYGDTAAPWQHLRAARFRAAENRRWLLRAAFTGVSAVIAPDGSLAWRAGRRRAGDPHRAVRRPQRSCALHPCAVARSGARIGRGGARLARRAALARDSMSAMSRAAVAALLVVFAAACGGKSSTPELQVSSEPASAPGSAAMPRVVAVDPPNGATGVDPARTSLSATFDREMDREGWAWVIERGRW